MYARLSYAVLCNDFGSPAHCSLYSLAPQARTHGPFSHAADTDCKTYRPSQQLYCSDQINHDSKWLFQTLLTLHCRSLCHVIIWRLPYATLMTHRWRQQLAPRKERQLVARHPGYEWQHLLQSRLARKPISVECWNWPDAGMCLVRDWIDLFLECWPIYRLLHQLNRHY